MAPEIRLPGTSEAGAIAELWHAGWHDAHAGLVPEALTRVRTRESFAARLPSIWRGSGSPVLSATRQAWRWRRGTR
jgi:hypothetical protein